MTQGYGPDHGQQGQWGQGEQSPQWGRPPQQAPEAQPQWGQASPAAPAQPQWGQASPAASGYPGAAPASAGQAQPSGLITWLFRGAIGVVVLRGLYLLANIVVSVFIVGLAATATTTDGYMAGAGIAMLLVLGALVIVDIASVALLVVAIIAAVQAQGRARTGALVVGAAVVLSFGAYILTRVVFTVVQAGMADFDALMVAATIEYVVAGLNWLVFSVAVVIGARMSKRAVARTA